MSKLTINSFFKLCDEVETVRKFTYLGDMVSAGGGCEAVMNPRTRYEFVKFRNVVNCCMADFH